jgi:menaquinone-dependent protoporphyrinogen IX oxidase
MNNSGRVLIAYASKGGATAESARIIAGVLRERHGLEVDVVDLAEDKKPDISGYDSVVIGSGIRIGMWYGRARGMMKRDFAGKRVAVFLSSMRAGKPEEYETARANYLQKGIDRWLKVKPVAAEAFGGWYIRKGVKTETNHDPDKVRAWADELGRKLAAS